MRADRAHVVEQVNRTGLQRSASPQDSSPAPIVTAIVALGLLIAGFTVIGVF
jgi:hypothetical protein